MTDCKQQVFQFQGLKSRKVTADFTGGYLSSDAGGGLFLGEVESRHGIIEELSECFNDGRDQRYVEHSVKELLAQRINGIALGYEDLNDHDRLRIGARRWRGVPRSIAWSWEPVGATSVIVGSWPKPTRSSSC